MGSLFLIASTLAFIALLNTSAQARPFPDCSMLKATILASYGRSLSPPPPSPVPSPQSKELTSSYGKVSVSPPPPPILSPSTHQLTNNYGRPTKSPAPPPPKPASPKGQLEIISSPCAEGTPCNKYMISMVVTADYYGRTARPPPPPPKPASPTSEVNRHDDHHQLVKERSPPTHFLASSAY